MLSDLKTIANSIPLAEVEEHRLAEKTRFCEPRLVWVVNYITRNPYPRKFVYSGCLFRHDTGRLCGQSLEFGSRCGHKRPGQPCYRFQIVCMDAVHGGMPSVRAQTWENGALLLKCPAIEFSKLSELEQIDKLQSILQKAPILQVSFWVKEFELKIHHSSVKAHSPNALSYTVDLPTQGSPIQKVESPTCSTPSKPKSAKKILAKLVAALEETDLSD